MVDGVIVLYDQNETSFTTNGLGYLPDATECIVTEELNGEFELQMEYPINGLRYKEIQHRRILLVKTNPYEDPQPFRIYNINKPIDGLVEINARHISYDLSGYAVPWIGEEDGTKSKLPFATGPASFMANIPELVNELNSEMPRFTFWTNSTEDYPRNPDPAHDKENELKEPHWIFIDQPMNARNLIGQFTEKYKGEFKWDKFNVQFYGPISGQSEDDTKYRGKDSGVVLRYGKNLTDLMQEEDSDKGMYTHIYPYWSGSIEYTKPNGEKGNKETIIELPEKLYPVFKDHTQDYKRIYVYDCTSDYTAELQSKDGQKHPSDETLKEMCDKLIKDNKLGTPNITLTASFVQLSKSVEYKDLALLEKILLGDTVTVYFPDLDVDSTLKCTSVEYNVLTDEYRTITLGEANASVSNTIANTASMSSSNSTAIAGSATKNDVFGKSYDTALSTTSENAVQNKVVTKAINNTNDQITNVRGDISKIITKIEGLTPGTGSITYGYSLPTGGSDGDAYVQLTKEAKDPKAIVTESSVHNNFEVSNFNRTGDKYSFDISGTVEDGVKNYALVNVENLTPGSEYKVTLKIDHDIPTSSLEASYYYDKWDGGVNWGRAFGIFIGNKNQLKSEYIPDGSWFHSNMKIGTAYYFDDPTIRGIKGTKAFSPHMDFQGIYKNVGEQEYNFYFKATYDSASFGFVFDDAVNGTTAHMSISDLEITYVGSPLIDLNNFSTQGDAFANATYNDNFEVNQGITDWTGNASWTNWGGSAAGETIFGFSFKQLQTFDRVKLNIWQGTTLDDSTPDVARNVYFEASVDDKAWNAEDKEWVNLMPNNEALDLLYPYGFIKHVYLDINEGTYHDVRVRFHAPTDGLMEAMQFYKREEILPDNHVKDLFFKCDGEWLVYPRDDDDDKTFGYGTEDPTEDTQNDIYAKLVEGSEPDTYDVDSIFYKVDSNWLLGPSGGGGGGSGYSKTLLYDSGSDTSGAPYNTDIPLLDDISNYDFVMLDYGRNADRSSYSPYMTARAYAPVDELLNGYDVTMEGYGTRYTHAKFTNTTFNLWWNGEGLTVFKIYGIKFSGGGSGGVTRETIWTGTAYVNSGSNTTTKPITDYDLLLCYHYDYVGVTSDEEAHLFWIDPKRIADNNYDVNQYDGNFEYTYYDNYYLRGKFTDATTFSIGTGNNAGALIRIDGIKFSGGGSGGGGSERCDLLYSAPDSTTPNTITLAHPYTDYEKLYISIYGTYNSGNFLIESTPFVADLEVNLKIGGATEDGYCWYTITDTQTLSKHSTGGGNGYYIKSIRGIGSGS